MNAQPIPSLTPLPQEGERFTIRPLVHNDFPLLQRMEEEIFGNDSAGKLCPHYLRLCTNLYAEWRFIALHGERPVGYVLNFPCGKVNYCATLAVHPEFQKGRANYLLIRAMVRKLLTEDMDECRFLVEPGNRDARSVHQSLGARVVAEAADFYFPGDLRLWSVIDRHDLERIRERYTRLKLVS